MVDRGKGREAEKRRQICTAMFRWALSQDFYAFADKRAEYGLALRALRAPDCFEGNARAALREESAATDARTNETDEKPSGAMRDRELLGHLRDLGFRAYLDQGALCLADTTGWRRNLFRYTSPTLVFEVLNAGLDDDPAMLGSGRRLHDCALDLFTRQSHEGWGYGDEVTKFNAEIVA